jgi:hypothetical protein
MKEVTLILRFVVIGLIYVIIFRLIKTMLRDMRVTKRSEASLDYALEVIEAPDLSGVALGTIFPVREETSIGRNKNNQIVINDPFISNKHAVVTLTQGELVIKDLNSTNGVILNSEIIAESSELRDGDVLEIGRVIFKIIG